MTSDLPQTKNECLREIGNLTREMAKEYQVWGESEKWKGLFDRKERVKDRWRELVAKD